MRKKHWLMMAMIMIISMIPFGANAQSTLIDVGLYYGSNVANNVTIYSDDTLMINGTAHSARGDRLRIVADREGAGLYNSGGLVYRSNYIEVSSTNGVVVLGNKPYRGRMNLTLTSGGVKVINTVDLEQYLYSVLPSEMSPSWHMEALKAQAVASRSFVLASLGGKHASDGFMVCDTTHCQVYRGTSNEYANTTRAADETSGLTLHYNGKVVSAYFSASNGGWVEDGADVWGGSSIAYIPSHQDIYDPETPYEKEMTTAEIENRLSLYGINIGKLTGVRIAQTSPSGLVTKLEFTGTAGTHVASNNVGQSILGLRSQRFWLGGGKASVSVIGKNGTKTDNDDLYILTPTEVYHTTSSISVMGATGVHTVTGGQSGHDGIYRIEGKGYGHGVGMSQYGARVMADQEFNFRDILWYYYRNATLE